MALSLTPSRDFPADLRCISLPEPRRRLFCLLFLAFFLPHPISRVTNSFTPNNISAKYHSAKFRGNPLFERLCFSSREPFAIASAFPPAGICCQYIPLQICAVTRTLLKRIHYGFYCILRTTKTVVDWKLRLKKRQMHLFLIWFTFTVHTFLWCSLWGFSTRNALKNETAAHSDLWH